MSSKIIPDSEIAEMIRAAGAMDALRCYQCGMCMAVCPWYQVDAVCFPVYQMPQAVRLGAMIASEDAAEIEHEVADVYRCVGCEACLANCPHGVDMPKVMRAIRRILVQYDNYPSELRDSVSRIQSDGNPYGESRDKRTELTTKMGVPNFDPTQEYLLFRCCAPAYDPIAKPAAQSIIRVLQQAGTTFGVLGSEESCCCESVRRAGAEDLFQTLATSNAEVFKAAGARRILTTSPHCYTTFKRDYGEVGADIEVHHYSQLFAKLIEEGRIKPQKALGKKVVYHDPCTLGRQNGIFEEPRQVLRAIPDLELVEIPIYNRADSLCCGGGSGGVWLDRPKGERMADVRIQQAVDTGAEILAVACPYCQQMFTDASKALGVDIEVKDIGELLAESL
jgi:Fe-S oxidoreductase